MQRIFIILLCFARKYVFNLFTYLTFCVSEFRYLKKHNTREIEFCFDNICLIRQIVVFIGDYSKNAVRFFNKKPQILFKRKRENATINIFIRRLFFPSSKQYQRHTTSPTLAFMVAMPFPRLLLTFGGRDDRRPRNTTQRREGSLVSFGDCGRICSLLTK